MKKEIYIVIILILCTLFLYGQEEIITITGDGNVGINNTSPQEKLDMTGALVIDGVLYSDTFAPQVKYFNLNDENQRTCTLPDADTVRHEVIILWYGGNSIDKVLEIQAYQNQTIDGKTSTDWNGEGRGKMRILPHNGDWIVLYYIDRRHQHVPLDSEDITYARHFIKLADGTLIQWGLKKNTSPDYSPITITFLKEFTSPPTVTASSHKGTFYTTIGDDSNPTTIGFDLYIVNHDCILGGTLDEPIYGFWQAYGRWYD